MFDKDGVDTVTHTLDPNSDYWICKRCGHSKTEIWENGCFVEPFCSAAPLEYKPEYVKYVILDRDWFVYHTLEAIKDFFMPWRLLSPKKRRTSYSQDYNERNVK